MIGKQRARWWTIGLLVTLMSSVAADERPPGPKDFFPFGVYIGGNDPLGAVKPEGMSLAKEIEWACADLEKHHFNCVWLNNLSPANLDLWLESAQRHGLRVIPQGGGPPMYLLCEPYYPNWRELVETQMKPWWFEFARKHRDSKALLAYSVVEEIPPDAEVIEKMASLTKMVAEVDPYHPMIILHNKLGAAQVAVRHYRPAIIPVDHYPFFADPGPDEYPNPHTWTSSHTYYERECARLYELASSVGAPGWMMGQGMHLESYKDGQKQPAGYRRPTPAEMHYQVWAALFHGLRGVFFFMYAGSRAQPPENGEFIHGLVGGGIKATPIYEEAAHIAADLEPLYPLLLDLRKGDLDEDVVYWEWDPHVRGRTFVNRGTRAKYLMIFNDDVQAAHEVRFEFGFFPGYLGENSLFYEVRKRCPLELREHNRLMLTEDQPLVIAPGDGTLVLVGDQRDIEQHQQRYE